MISYSPLLLLIHSVVAVAAWVAGTLDVTVTYYAGVLCLVGKPTYALVAIDSEALAGLYIKCQ
jgi:hypothetical protein